MLNYVEYIKIPMNHPGSLECCYAREMYAEQTLVHL